MSWSFSHVSTCGSTYCSMAGRVGFTCPRYRTPEEQGCTVTLPTPLPRFPPQWQPCCFLDNQPRDSVPLQINICFSPVLLCNYYILLDTHIHSFLHLAFFHHTHVGGEYVGTCGVVVFLYQPYDVPPGPRSVLRALVLKVGALAQRISITGYW